MSDDSDVVLVETKETSVVVTPGDSIVSIVVEEKQVITDEMQSVALLESPEIHVVAEGQQGPAGGDGAFIDDVSASLLTTFSGTHILELLSPFSISSFSVSPVSTEMGQTVSSTTFDWASNYVPDTVSISNGIGSIVPASLTTKVAAVSLTTNTTFTITMVRNGVTKTANATVGFLNRVYYGVDTVQTTNQTVLKDMASVLSGSRARTITFNCTGGKYFHLAYPSRFGTATFQINNLTYSDMTMTVVSITNAYGFTENYNVHYCNVIQNGAAITLVVS